MKIRVSFEAELPEFKPHAVDAVLAGGLHEILQKGKLTAVEATVAQRLIQGLGATDLTSLVQPVDVASAPVLGSAVSNAAKQQIIDSLDAQNTRLHEDLDRHQAELEATSELAEAGVRCAQLAQSMFEHNLNCRKSGCWQCAGRLMRLRDWTRTLLAKAKRAEAVEPAPAPTKP